MVCRFQCHKFLFPAGNPELKRNGKKYEKGLRYCSTCEKYIHESHLIRGIKCPCCRYSVREHSVNNLKMVMDRVPR